MSATTTLVDAPRAGVKGPGAAQWLAARGLPVPAQPNSWLPLDGGGVIGRLAFTEFFVEGPPAPMLEREAREAPDGVYPVLRRDTGLELAGAGAPDVLAQTCNVNFAALALDARPLVMTSMVGVAVLVIPQRRDEGVAYRIWCDPTYGPYLARTLQAIAAEEDGDAAPARPPHASTISRGGP